mmetsp:Transcript_11133/g.22177  ORF Transcript_11133/g.22177 Transcript_11133/m.22177 type:complete len:464 (+) Transcript_11133:41-1432(+)
MKEKHCRSFRSLCPVLLISLVLCRRTASFMKPLHLARSPSAPWPLCMTNEPKTSRSAASVPLGGEEPPPTALGGGSKPPYPPPIDWFGGDGWGGEEEDEELQGLLVDASSTTKKAADDLFTQMSRGLGPMVQFMPRRIPSFLRALASPSAASYLKPMASQFPQLIRLTALLGTDLLFLHSMAALAGASTIAYNWWIRAPLVGRKVVAFPVTWNGIFMTINLVQVHRLLKKRRPIDFSREELDVFSTGGFQARMSARDFHHLLRDCGGVFRTVPPGTNLCTENERLQELMFITSPNTPAMVDIGGSYVGNVSPQSFVGEMSFLEMLDHTSGVHKWWFVPRFLSSINLSRVFGEFAAATVYTGDEGVRILSWKQSKLVGYMRENPEFANAFEGMLAADLVKKLKSTRNSRSRELVVPKGQKGLSRKRLKMARRAGAIKRRGIFKMWLRDVLRRPAGWKPPEPAVP